MSVHGGPKQFNGKFYSELTEAEKQKLKPEALYRLQHEELHEKHKGHEQMHAEMFFVLIITLIIAQVILIQWRKIHNKSYMRATLFFMWCVPLYFVIYHHWLRFFCFWCFYSCMNGYIVYMATKSPLDASTPRRVYKWFLFMHKASYTVGIIGYFVVLFTLMGVNVLMGITPDTSMDFGLVVLFYGLYFGVLGRDFSVLCTDRIAAKIGFLNKDDLPKRSLTSDVCSVCAQPVLVSEHEDGIIEDTVRLNCNHIFHEFCIRGWCIVGKKETCPYCNEKVDMKELISHPWEKVNAMYGQFLDWLRYLVAWQPVIILLVQGINWVFGLE